MRIKIFLFLFLISLHAFAQDSTLVAAIGEKNTPYIDTIATSNFCGAVAYSTYELDATTAKDGHLFDLPSLIQHRLPGLGISKSGSDPNQIPEMRLRGLNTLTGSTSPMIIVDDIPNVPLELVDVLDINAIEISAKNYGIRGANGALELSTLKDYGSSIVFKSYLAYENIAYAIPIADRTAFVAERGSMFDFNNNQNWLRTISRPQAFSNGNHLHLHKKGEKTDFAANFSQRTIQGIGRHTNLQTLAATIHLKRGFLKENKLRFSANLYANDRTAEHDFLESFRYATIYNPTLPIRDAAGNFQETAWFDYYNPLAIQEQNFRQSEQTHLMGKVGIDWTIYKGWSIFGNYAHLNTQRNFGQYFSKTAYFRGENSNGVGNLSGLIANTQTLSSGLKYQKQWNNSWEVNTEIRYDFQEISTEYDYERGIDFSTDLADYQDLKDNLAIAANERIIFADDGKHRLIGGIAAAAINYNDWLFSSIQIRREGSSRLGENNKWGWFPSANISANIADLFGGTNAIFLQTSWAKTGGLPPVNELSNRSFSEEQLYYSEDFYPAYFSNNHNANPDLTFQTKTEWDIGTKLFAFHHKLAVEANYFQNRVDDLIDAVAVDVNTNLYPITWANYSDLRLQNRGIEAEVNVLIENEDFTWNSAINCTHIRTSTQRLSEDLDDFRFFDSNNERLNNRAFPGAPGGGAVFLFITEPDEAIGQIRGLEVIGNSSGILSYADKNGDGIIDFFNDSAPIASGLPKYSIGFHNNIAYKKWGLAFFLRGDFGHYLWNANRYFYETNIFSPFNFLQTEFATSGLASELAVSDYNIEKASYLALDYVQLGYTFDLKKERTCRVYFNARDLIYETGYTGNDPSVRYTDFGSSDNSGRVSNIPDYLAPGLDRRNYYPRTWSAALGIEIRL